MFSLLPKLFYNFKNQQKQFKFKTNYFKKQFF
jgi:hypothetical protein